MAVKRRNQRCAPPARLFPHNLQEVSLANGYDLVFAGRAALVL